MTAEDKKNAMKPYIMANYFNGINICFGTQ